MHCQQDRVLIWQRPMRAIVARSNSSIFNVKASLVPKRLRGVQRNAYTKSRKNHRIRKGNRQFIELLAGSETPGAYGSFEIASDRNARTHWRVQRGMRSRLCPKTGRQK